MYGPDLRLAQAIMKSRVEEAVQLRESNRLVSLSRRGNRLVSDLGRRLVILGKWLEQRGSAEPERAAWHPRELSGGKQSTLLL